jgi:hypothetical protein
MLTFPTALRPVGGGFAQNVKSISGGQSLSGFEQVSSSVSDRWQASYKFPVNRNDRVLALRAFILSMRGRANTVALPMFDNRRAPWAVNQYGITQTPAVRRNRALDGTAFADASNFNDTLIIASLSASAAVLATSVSIGMTLGSAPKPGHFFSIGARGYSILSVSGSGPYIVEIWPWLRVAATAGVTVNFTSPVCEMRFASDNEGAEVLKGLDLFKFGSLTLNFDEAAVTS